LNVTLIHFDQFDSDLSVYQVALSLEERQRAERFLREQDRRAYVITHYELRRLLAEQLNVEPSHLEIVADEHGKPYLPNYSDSVCFNISHSGECALIAIADVPVGVDIEKKNEKSDFLAIAERFFTQDEFSYISGKPYSDQKDAFYTVWTLKESFVKAVGQGIVYGLDKFSVISPEMLIKESVESMQLQVIEAPEGYMGAICLENEAIDIISL